MLITNSVHLNQSSALLEKACQYVWDAQDVESDMPSSLDVALLLSQLSVDETTIMVCLLSDSRLRSTEFHKVIEHAFSDEILHMVQSLEK
ncbi:MAG: GTP diphosphokinase, partial [Mariprofundaceae bacterium]|nr:GTP diphosphokinase [Mariprofundaceae bacterium]